MSKRSKSLTGDIERLLGAIEPYHRRCKVREAVDSHFGDGSVRWSRAQVFRAEAGGDHLAAHRWHAARGGGDAL